MNEEIEDTGLAFVDGESKPIKRETCDALKGMSFNDSTNRSIV